jgi:hypothetical protein
MHAIEEALARACGFVEKLEQRFDLSPNADPKKLHNMYVDAIVASSMLKNYMLNAAMVRAVNTWDFLSYALAGRSLIEVTATLRYYLHTQLRPIVDACVKASSVRYDQLAGLIETEDRVLRGGRFDWLKFFLNQFAALQDDYAEGLEAKKRGGGAAKRPGDSSSPKQVNVITCIERWAREARYVGVLYELFCDMVHPNIGSTLCIAVPRDGGIAFMIDQENSTGVALFDRSFPLLQSIAGKEFAEIVHAYILLKMPEEQEK